jgi:gas vesicle protein
MSREANLLEGLLLGGLIGAALGILFAPQAGEKNREALKDILKEFGLEGFVDRISEAFEAGKEEAERIGKEVEM